MEKPVRTNMANRRPIHLPQSSTESEIQHRESYFSENLARDQHRRQMVISAMYRPSFGIYKFCKTTPLSSHAVSENLKGVICCKISSDKRFLVLGFGNGTIEVVYLTTGDKENLHPAGLTKKITSIKVANRNQKNDTFYASSLAGKVFIANHSPEKFWETHILIDELKNEINTMDYAQENTLTTAGKDATIRHYDVQSEKANLPLGVNVINPEDFESVMENKTDILIRTFKKYDQFNKNEGQERGHVKRICALKYGNQSNDVFVTGGWDNTIKIWDIRCPDFPVGNIYGFHVNGDSLDVLDNSILCGQWTNKNGLHLLDMRTFKVITPIIPLNRPILYSGEFITSVRFMKKSMQTASGPSPFGDIILVTGYGTCALEIISLMENMVLHTATEAKPVFALDYEDYLIAYGGYCQEYTTLSFSPHVSKVKIHGMSYERIESSRSLSTFMTSIDSATKKFFELGQEVEESKYPTLTQEERFMKPFLEEVKAQSGTGPQSLVGEKLCQYLNKLKVEPDFSETEELNMEDSTGNKMTYNTFDISHFP